MDDVVFQWLGTAGFRILHHGKVILVDPYLTRNERATPRQGLRPEDMSKADLIFLSHGHFDHVYDVPAIVDASGASVYCSGHVAKTLERMGVPRRKIYILRGGEALDLETFNVKVAASRHIRFDLKLVARTMPGVVRERSAFREFRHMTAGPVLLYSLDFEGLKVMHLGSLGLKPADVGALGLETPAILMPPLQGHSDICRRAALVTAELRPRAVIPQHHDDFYPPMSQTIDLEPFRRLTAELRGDCRYYEPVMNREFTAAEVLESP
jgi:L-ascorbate metabolism protein UlaG (beta-lactamase superfamily)